MGYGKGNEARIGYVRGNNRKTIRCTPVRPVRGVVTVTERSYEMKNYRITEVSAMRRFKAGEQIFFSGVMYTARDQAHKKMVALLSGRKKIPLDLRGQLIYYCGPTETPPRKAIGSCGPTTSSRMDQFVEPLLKVGLIAMIGKGRRSKKARELIKKYKAVYFVAPAGCAALLAQKVISKELVAFGELGPEAIYRLEVKDFPLIVAIDSRGRSIYPDL